MPFAPDTFTYSPLICALCVRRRVLDALGVFDGMLLCGCSPSLVTYSILLVLQAGHGAPRRDARQGLRTRHRDLQRPHQ
jgi:pentatricopeptide repeat protein